MLIAAEEIASWVPIPIIPPTKLMVDIFSLWLFRQERRSKIYSFGLGKRGNSALTSDLAQQQEDYQDEQGGTAADKRSRQFSFGLGKREAEPSSIHTNNTS